MGIIDITVPLETGCPVYPGDEPFKQWQTSAIAAGDGCTVSAFAGSAHLGTHVDAPRHFIADGESIDQLDPEIFVGPALVADIQTDGDIRAADLDAAIGAWPERLLIRSRNSLSGGWLDRGEFDADACGLTLDAAERAIARHVRLIGIDSLSVAAASDTDGVHRALLGAGIVVLEGLDLRHVSPGHYTLVALPLKLTGLDGSPARAVLSCESDV